VYVTAEEEIYASTRTAVRIAKSQFSVITSIRVLKGRHDATLKWPFRGKELLNQLTDRNHFTQAEEVMLREGEQTQCLSIDHPKLAHNREMNTQYLMDDTLYFRVSVKVESDGPKPWLKCTAPPFHCIQHCYRGVSSFCRQDHEPPLHWYMSPSPRNTGKSNLGWDSPSNACCLDLFL
jgi:hypothetical protein